MKISCALLKSIRGPRTSWNSKSQIQILFYRLLACAGIIVDSLVGAFAYDEEEMAKASAKWAGPSAVAVRPDGKRLYVAAERASELLVIDPEGRKVRRSFTLPNPPTGMAWTPNYEELVLTCSGLSNSVLDHHQNFKSAVFVGTRRCERGEPTLTWHDGVARMPITATPTGVESGSPSQGRFVRMTRFEPNGLSFGFLRRQFGQKARLQKSS